MPKRRRLGLRARVTVIYALGALLLTTMVAIGTFALTQARLVREREDTARAAALQNAIDLRRRLQSVPQDQLQPTDQDLDAATARSNEEPPTPSTSALPGRTATSASVLDSATSLPVDLDDLRDSLGIATTTTSSESLVSATSAGEQAEAISAAPIDAIIPILEDLQLNSAEAVLRINEEDRSLSGLTLAEVPVDLRQAVSNGQIAEKRYNAGGVPRFTVGVPLQGFDASYFEVVNLTDLERTLYSLQVILGGTALAASLAGAALGSYLARRALHPLVDVSSAAASIAVGQFDTRLDARVDPDLTGLTSSFNHMVDALQERVERDGRFASNVSHELRSPLMTLAASVGVLQGRKSEMPLPAQQAVDLLSDDLERFEGLVEDLLEISRMDVGAVKLDLAPLFLAEFLRFVVADPDIPIRYGASDASLIIMADKRRLAQAITNLLTNAEKYAGGATQVSFRRNDDRDTKDQHTNGRTSSSVDIFIDDEGPGVRAEDRQRIFDRFTRARGDAGRREVATGVGLGLSLVSEHVRLHGGTVRVTDRPGGSGARFVVTIPVGEQLDFDEEMAT